MFDKNLGSKMILQDIWRRYVGDILPESYINYYKFSP